jgi:hypothetical protein
MRVSADELTDPALRAKPIWAIGHFIAAANYVTRPWTVTCSCGFVVVDPQRGGGSGPSLQSLLADHRKTAPPEPPEKRPEQGAKTRAAMTAAMARAKKDAEEYVPMDRGISALGDVPLTYAVGDALRAPGGG